MYRFAITLVFVVGCFGDASVGYDVDAATVYEVGGEIDSVIFDVADWEDEPTSCCDGSDAGVDDVDVGSAGRIMHNPTTAILPVPGDGDGDDAGCEADCESGDGDGDWIEPAPGDGDGDTGDGDGDWVDPTPGDGDGDGDAPVGDGDGDAMCDSAATCPECQITLSQVACCTVDGSCGCAFGGGAECTP